MNFLTKLAQQILIAVLGNSDLTRRILDLVGLPAQEDTAQEILGLAAETDSNVTAIKTVVDAGVISDATFQSAVAGALATIISDIGNLQLAANPVILPTIPPTGYGGGSSIAAADVWAYPSPLTGATADDRLDNASMLALNMGTVGARLPVYHSTYFNIAGTWWSTFGPATYGSQPIFPIASILGGDTLVSFLNRESTWTGWALNPDGFAYVREDVTSNDFEYQTSITAAEFITLRDGVSPLGVVNLPPIWPGVAGITYGSPTSFADSFTITTPMDGIAVTIDSVPPDTAAFEFDGESSWRWIGSLAFFNDDDLIETYQNLGFHYAVYTPKTMVQAKGVKVRTKHGSTGRVWPWTINPI